MRESDRVKGTSPKSTQPEWGCILLAGGQSQRMGTSKARLPATEGDTVLEYMIRQVQGLYSPIVVMTNKQDIEYFASTLALNPEISFVLDEEAFQLQGPLAGMYTGMNVLQAQWYLVLACDMVFVDHPFLFHFKQFVSDRNLVSQSTLESKKYSVYIPVSDNKRLQPLVGCYRYCAPTIEALLQNGKRSMKALLSELSVYDIKPNEWQHWTTQSDPFYNMNYPEDYAYWRLTLEEETRW
ncbi:NTP transferase domain-containing protein [Caldalkalibacillus salinus]|uniref:NTP transferase domain-containing protein n=1 Tax=Caldalkalibacillus salinus TaxID=2803787 RepID=UPI001922E908